MKSGRTAVALAGAVVVAGIAYAFLRSDRRASDTAKAETSGGQAKASAIVQVDDLAANPGRFQGEIVVQAVVARVKPAEGIFAVIDAREFERCRSVTCAQHYVPVKFAGTLPKSETVVQMIGQIVSTDKGMVFQAKSVEAIP